MNNQHRAFKELLDDLERNIRPNQSSSEIAESLRLKYESDRQEAIKRLEGQTKNFYCEICNEVNGKQSMPHKLKNGEWICTGCFKPMGKY